jgi:hypothetical protein
MEISIWIAIALVIAAAVWRAAPYHQRLIANRDLPQKDWWD